MQSQPDAAPGNSPPCRGERVAPDVRSFPHWTAVVPACPYPRWGKPVNRRIVRRTAAVTAAGGLAATAGLLPALPALAHGAPVRPVSRTAACAAGGVDPRAGACRAAVKANGGPF